MSAPSYLVLARKYRPRTFDEVTGQAVVTGVLRGALEEDRVGHAYLFCGPRGTGKTTTARIFAKALNCERGAKSGPCNECERCLSADAGSEPDLVEIDAASHTGVDNVRDLRDQAAYAPMRAQHKIYIIDEVHMLSRGAFNALLKTLEEPPPHVKFLFATTEPHKLPDTIVSRCQVLKLSALSEADITGRLEEVCRLEGLEPGEGVLAEVARRARGGMRDALSLTDQLIALAGKAPALSDLDRLSTSSGLREVDALLALVEAGDRRGVLEALDAGGGGETQLLDALLEHVRLTLVAALCGADAPHLGDSAELRRIASERAARVGPDRLQIWLEELLAARDRLRGLHAHARLVLEMALLGLCDGARTLPLGELAERLAALEARLGGAPATPPAPAPTSASSAPAAERERPRTAAREPRTPGRVEEGVLEPAPRPEPPPAPPATSAPPATPPRSAPAPEPVAARPADEPAPAR